jgi:N utilization substance protein B
MDLPGFDPDDDISVEVIEHDSPATDRSFARRIALQVLYELDTTGHQADEVISARLDAQDPGRKEARYVRLLVQGVLSYRSDIDKLIREFVAEWPLEQIATIDRNILRLAILEFGIEQKAPVSVVIDEAVGLARVFGSESSLRFVNGVLGKLVADEPRLMALHALKGEGKL